MSQKGFVNIISIGIVVVLLGIGGYFVWLEYGPQPCVQSLLPAEAVNKKTGDKKIFEYPCAVPRGWIITDYHPATTLQPTSTPTPQPSPTPTPTTSAPQNPVDNKWKMFQNNRFAFQFEYPAEWSVLDKLDDPYGVNFWLAEKNMATVIMDIESGMNLSLMGVSYCGAYPQDKRCESLKTESGGYVTIDWDVSGKANAMFSSQDGTSGVSFTFHKVNSETKNTFRKILSTFKFLK